MPEPTKLPTGTPAGWYADPLNLERQRFWDGVAWTAQTATEPGRTEPSFTTEEYLRAIGVELTRIRSSVNIIALLAFVLLILLALWFAGAVTAEVDDSF